MNARGHKKAAVGFRRRRDVYLFNVEILNSEKQAFIELSALVKKKFIFPAISSSPGRNFSSAKRLYSRTCAFAESTPFKELRCFFLNDGSPRSQHHFRIFSYKSFIKKNYLRTMKPPRFVPSEKPDTCSLSVILPLNRALPQMLISCQFILPLHFELSCRRNMLKK